jgi:hypothetical protein
MSADMRNRYWQPGTINDLAAGMNPWVWNAMRGIQGNGNQFSQDMYNIAQGKDISPYLLNQPLNQINQSYNGNMANMTAQLGRSNMSGGLGQAYQLANQMGRQNATANLYQNYGQWREQQRRSDLNWLMGLMQNSQNQGFNLAQNHVFKKNFWEKLGAFGQGFVGASGMGGGGQKTDSTKPADFGNSQNARDYGSPWGAGTGEGGGASTPATNYGSNYGGNYGGGEGGYTGWNGQGGYTGYNANNGYDPRTQMGSGKLY